MRALITGISGFAGSHLADHLLGKNYEVYGSIRWRSRTENIRHIFKDLNLIECDLRDSHSTFNLIKTVEPDVIFHLAAQSFVPTSWHSPEDTIYTNVVGTVNLLQAVTLNKLDPVIQIAGSSEEYGLVYKDEVPIKETNPTRPLSPYAVSKVAETLLGYQYQKSYSLKIILTRAFNHTGPRNSDVFVVSNFARQIAEIEKNKKTDIEVGNLISVRDFSDVRDIVQAYEFAIRKCKYGELYNISSGKGIKIKEILDMLISMANKEIKIREDPKRKRPSDVPLIIGNSEKFINETGWKPKIKLEKTLEDLLNFWRDQV
jgi:GDP-4-dehydro-6-deoxy-D-mannose reductase